ncbi:MAG: MarR family transcriptional regulator [Bacillota bacterium]|jgi:DNA-binding MarR family transcriptional regulator
MESYRDVIRRIMHSLNVIDGVYDKWSKMQGLKENTLLLLYVLDDDQAHSQKQICEEWLISKTTLNTIIKECETKGYIELKQWSGHKQEKQIYLTEMGREYAANALASIYKAEEEAMAKTLAECSDSFVRGLECFCENFKNTLANQKERTCLTNENSII